MVKRRLNIFGRYVLAAIWRTAKEFAEFLLAFITIPIWVPYVIVSESPIGDWWRRAGEEATLQGQGRPSDELLRATALEGSECRGSD